MAVIPSLQTSLFCQWMLSTSWIRFTSGRKQVVQDIQAASLAQAPVTDLAWSNFLLSTYRFYLIWMENVSFNPNVSYSNEAIAYFNQVTTPFSTQRMNLIEQLIARLKFDGNWQYLDRLWLLANEAADQGLVSVVNPTSTKIVVYNSPVFTVDRGYTGNGSTTYMDTGYNILSSSQQLSLNSNCNGVYINSNTLAENAYDLGAYDAFGKIIGVATRYTGDFFYGNTLDAGSMSIHAANTDTRGMFTAVRTSASSQSLYKNGSALVSDSQLSTGLFNANVYLLALSVAGSPADYSSKRLAAAYLGSSKINQSTLYASIQSYMTAIGAAV